MLQSAENNVERRDALALASQISAWDGLLSSGSNRAKRRRLAAEQGIPLGEQGWKRLDAANLQDVQAFFVAHIAAEQLAGHLPFWRLFPQQTDAVTEVLRWIVCRPKDDKCTQLYCELVRWHDTLQHDNRESRLRCFRECRVGLPRKENDEDKDRHAAIARAHYSPMLWSLRMRVRTQTKGGERAVAEDAAVTSEETKPTEAETEVRGFAEPALRLKNARFFEEMRRALAEAKKDPTVTADLLNDIRALQTTDRQSTSLEAPRPSQLYFALRC